MAMALCTVNCTDTGKDVKADILKRGDKELQVALHGTQFKLVLRRSDIRRPYVGNMSGMEFTTRG